MVNFLGKIAVFICLATSLSGGQLSTEELAGCAIKAADIFIRAGQEISRANSIEVTLVDAQAVTGKPIEVTPDGVQLQNSVGVRALAYSEMKLLRLKHKGASRLRRVLGGVLGGFGGWMLGAPLAFSIGDSGNEAVAISVLVAMPIAGVWLGLKLAGKPRACPVSS